MEPIWSEWGINCHAEKLKLLMVDVDRPVAKASMSATLPSPILSKQKSCHLFAFIAGIEFIEHQYFICVSCR
jgi:hypothetical protein